MQLFRLLRRLGKGKREKGREERGGESDKIARRQARDSH